MSSSLIAPTTVLTEPTRKDLKQIAKSLRHSSLNYTELGRIHDQLEAWEPQLDHLAEYWYLRATARELLFPSYRANSHAVKYRSKAADCAKHTPLKQLHYAEHRLAALDTYSQHSPARLGEGLRRRYQAATRRAQRDIEALSH